MEYINSGTDKSTRLEAVNLGHSLSRIGVLKTIPSLNSLCKVNGPSEDYWINARYAGYFYKMSILQIVFRGQLTDFISLIKQIRLCFLQYPTNTSSSIMLCDAVVKSMLFHQIILLLQFATCNSSRVPERLLYLKKNIQWDLHQIQ